MQSDQSYAPIETAPLSADERKAIKASKAAAARGEFATEEQIKFVWAKHGL
jgi:predicted transcriptional regulator